MMEFSALWEKWVGEVQTLLLTKIGVLVEKCPTLCWSPPYHLIIEVPIAFWGSYYKILLHQYGLTTHDSQDTYLFWSIVFP